MRVCFLFLEDVHKFIQDLRFLDTHALFLNGIQQDFKYVMNKWSITSPFMPLKGFPPLFSIWIYFLIWRQMFSGFRIDFASPALPINVLQLVLSLGRSQHCHAKTPAVWIPSSTVWRILLQLIRGKQAKWNMFTPGPCMTICLNRPYELTSPMAT